MLFSNTEIGKLNEQLLLIGVGRTLRIPRYYLNENLIKAAELDRLVELYQVDFLTSMTCIEESKALQYIRRFAGLSFNNACLLSLAACRGYSILLTDAALYQPCKSLGIAVVEAIRS